MYFTFGDESTKRLTVTKTKNEVSTVYRSSRKPICNNFPPQIVEGGANFRVMGNSRQLHCRYMRLTTMLRPSKAQTCVFLARSYSTRQSTEYCELLEARWRHKSSSGRPVRRPPMPERLGAIQATKRELCSNINPAIPL
jgi:hypothetical protein